MGLFYFSFFISGDNRVNEQPDLTVIHTLWVSKYLENWVHFLSFFWPKGKATQPLGENLIELESPLE